MTEAGDVNLAWWDERARLHGQDGFYYDTAGFLEGDLAITERERSELTSALGRLEGKDILHMQCHIGLTTLSLGRLGARTVGVDFSPVAIERARAIAETARVVSRFVLADVQHLPDELAGRFDCVFASFGVLMWIADLDAWMRSAWMALRDGGKLVLLEGHPISLVIRSADPVVLEGPYQGGTPVARDDGDYADPTADTEHRAAIHFRWGLGDVVTSSIDTGFMIEALTEWTDDESGIELPSVYSLRAHRSG